MNETVNQAKEIDSDIDSCFKPSNPKKIKMTTNEGDVKLPAGLELIYQLERQNVRNALDAFVLTLHWTIVRAGLRIKSGSEPDVFTEKLPANWSGPTGQDTSNRHLTFDYFFPEKPSTRYQVRVVELTPDDQVVVTINLTNATGENVASDQAPPANGAGQQQETNSTPASNPKDRSASTYFIGDFIKKSLFTEQSPELNSAVQVFFKCTELERQIWVELMEPVNIRVSGAAPLPGPYDDHTPRPTESPTQAAERERERRRRNLREGRSSLIEDGRRPQPLPMGPIGGIGRIGPPGIGGPLGRSDLDPLGGIGAGMLADPRGFRRPAPGGLNPGQMPPGARFDPFGPPNPGRPGGGRGQWGELNPDHEQPPPGFDDMFM